MNEDVAKRYEIAHPDLLMIDSLAGGMHYFVDKEKQDSRVAILGQRGVTILTREQAEVLVDELLDIFDVFTKTKGRRYGGAFEECCNALGAR